MDLQTIAEPYLTALRAISGPCYDPPDAYIPQEPTERQRAFLALPHREAFYGGAAGGGKALSIYAIIPTPKRLKVMADIQVGDEVFGMDGKTHKVLATSEIMTGHRVFDVVFDDGTTVRADAEHLWETFTYAERSALHKRSPEYREQRRKNRKKRGTGRRPDLAARNALQSATYTPLEVLGGIRTTLEIKETLYADKKGRLNHAIKMPAPLDFPEKQLPIEPYLFGFWLGDGDCSGGRLTIGDQYKSDALQILKETGWEVRKQPAANWGYRVVGLTTALKLSGYLDNKHIPEEYLQGSIDQRKALLCGLMDTDGYACKDGQCEFYSSSDILVRGASRLLHTLGIKHAIRVKVPPKNTHHSHSYRIKFVAPFPVFRLEEKRKRQNLKLRDTQKWRYVVEVREVESEPVKCIAVDSPDKLYLAGEECVPTHNSSALLMGALQYVDIPGYSALILRRTFQDLAKPNALLDRAKSWLKNTSATWNETLKQWRFPSGAVLAFGYLENESDKYQYQSAEFQYVAFDELSQFTETQYTYLFSRLRRLVGSNVPVRMRSGSNPGGAGEEWVEARFIPEHWNPDDRESFKVEEKAGRAFVPARMDDNPHLDQEEYEKSLEELDAVTREQLRRGVWRIRPKGNIYPMWSDGPDGHHVITWSQFKEVIKQNRIPADYLGALGQDWGFSPDPCANIWCFTASENAPRPSNISLKGDIFIPATMTRKLALAEDVGNDINALEAERDWSGRIQYRVMSHEASSQQATYNRKCGLNFVKWEPDVIGGISQVESALKIRHKDKPHPFKPHLMGRPGLYVIVPDDQMENPKGDEGMALLRAEFRQYKYVEQIITNQRGSNRIVPYDFFNHYMDALRGIAAKWFPRAKPLSDQELIEKQLPPDLQAENAPAPDGSWNFEGWSTARQIEIGKIKKREEEKNAGQGDPWKPKSPISSLASYGRQWGDE